MLKTRVISSVAALAVLAFGIFIFETEWFNIFVLLVGLICVFEITRASGMLKNIPLVISTAVFFAVLLLPGTATVTEYFIYLFVAFMLLYFFFSIAVPKSNVISGASVSFVMLTVVACGMLAWLLIRDNFGPADGRFLFFMCFAFPLCGDMFAYFFGRKFGKHKLCEHISPKKTTEGALAAVLLAPLYSSLWLFLYTLLPAYDAGKMSGVRQWQLYVFFALLGLANSVLGIAGDLLASAVKRFCGVKDFGNLMPGHGGAVDRLDSVCFTSPVTALSFMLVFKYIFKVM